MHDGQVGVVERLCLDSNVFLLKIVCGGRSSRRNYLRCLGVVCKTGECVCDVIVIVIVIQVDADVDNRKRQHE